jgi:uncharacterized protein YecE (DUF72 family)
MLFIGTSSYSFKEWVGPFYPPGTPSSRYLSYYSSCLNSVEMNYTYRRFPTERSSIRWASETPESFRFSLKMHQSVTHTMRLKHIERPLKDFLEALKPVGGRLGVVLIQLPPNFPADAGRLEDVLDQLPADQHFAFEFRHPSWNTPEIRSLLRKAGAALCASEEEILSRVPEATASHAYVRIRKAPPYSDEEVSFLRRQIRELSRNVKDLYFYIKHDTEALAPRLALQLKELEEWYSG